jgi:hypothetical protein
MKHRVWGIAASVLLLGSSAWIAGCGGSPSNEKPASDEPAQAGAEAAEANRTAPSHSAATPAEQESPPAHVIPAGTEVTLTGTVGCGHCTYQVGNSCSAAIKTSDGIVWVLDGIGAGDELFENRFDGGEVTMAGVVHYVDGVAHLTPAEKPADGSQM